MTHDELQALTGGYALDALNEAERRELEAHLATCAACAREVRELRDVAGALAHAVPQHDPPAALRERVLRAAVVPADSAALPFAPRAQRRGQAWPAWFAVAASIAAVAFGLYAMALRQRIDVLQGRLRDASARAEDLARQAQVAHAVADQARETSTVLAASDLRRIDLAGQKSAPDAAGHAFWSPSQRRLVMTGVNLPSLRAGRQYQLWVIPPGGVPISAGMLTLEVDRTVTALAPPLTVDQVGIVAVTEEPSGGGPAPTTAPILAGSVTQ